MSPADHALIAQTASGSLVAQQVIESVRAGHREPESAWLKFIELTARYGKHSPAARAFILEFVKHIRV